MSDTNTYVGEKAVRSQPRTTAGIEGTDEMSRLHLLLRLLVCCVLLVSRIPVYAAQAESEADVENTVSTKETDIKVRPRIEDNWIARDKALHIGASAAIVGLAHHSYHCQLRNPEGDSRVLAVSLSALCGIGKELWDLKTSPRGLSWKDLVADGVGILLGVALFTL